jgi:prepilin-type N-terminal cleavage/methylation domain-containing protein
MRAFTLIELLIVVAIIAILAAIAVPNFLEAQTRAKVSRAKADIRTLVTATEAYRVDHTNYPDPSDENGVQQPPGSFTPLIFETKTSTQITTPIAYITSRLDDPFPNPNGENSLFHFSTIPNIRAVINDPISLGLIETFLGTTVQYLYISQGPDLQHDPPNVLSLNPTANVYDPTNGTVSVGDIIYRGPGEGFDN